MKSLIEIPLEQFNLLLDGCAVSDEERSILESGVVLEDCVEGERRVAIICESQQAKMIIDLASRVSPEASYDIREFTALKDAKN